MANKRIRNALFIVFKAVLVLLPVCLLLVSCRSIRGASYRASVARQFNNAKESPEFREKIAGTWVHVETLTPEKKEERNDAASYFTGIYTFLNNGSFSVKYEYSDSNGNVLSTLTGDEGTWKATNSHIVILYPYNVFVEKIPYFLRDEKTLEYGAIVLNKVTPGGNTAVAGIEGILERAAKDVAENFTARSRVAIIYIVAQDRSHIEYITGELEHILRRQGFVIIDRSELDRIRREQRFQISGEVDDGTAVSIGKFAGANIIVTGRVDGEGNLRRLRLRALDTATAQVVGTASERL